MNNQQIYEPITGSPDRSTGQMDTGVHRASDSRKKRVSRISVTPADRDRLDAVAAKLGIPRSCVYNMAFQRLAEELRL
jgi:hypothetical protein